MYAGIPNCIYVCMYANNAYYNDPQWCAAFTRLNIAYSLLGTFRLHRSHFSTLPPLGRCCKCSYVHTCIYMYLCGHLCIVWGVCVIFHIPHSLLLPLHLRILFLLFNIACIFFVCVAHFMAYFNLIFNFNCYHSHSLVRLSLLMILQWLARFSGRLLPQHMNVAAAALFRLHIH